MRRRRPAGGARRPGLRLYVYDLPVRSGVAYCYSLVSPAQLLTAGGLPRPAILGVSDRPEPLAYERFRPNLLFVDLLHDVLARHGPQDPGLVAQAAALGEGRLPVWDLRSAHVSGPRAPEELLGWFEVRAGSILTGRYTPNPEHTLLSRHGLFELPAAAQDPLMRALLELRVPGRPVEGEH